MTSNCLRLLTVCALFSIVRAYIVVAPSQLVAGNEETILIVNDQNRALQGEVTLEDNPNLGDDEQYGAEKVNIQPGQIALIKFRVNQRFTPHIDLKTTLNGVKKTKMLRVSQKSGHIFLQTDKPIYNPKETTVHIRFMATDENLLPANRTYRLQVKNPDGQLAMSQDFYESSQSLFSFNYTLPEDPILGEWLVSVQYGDGFKQSERLTFLMEEYVLPTFKVEVEMPETLLPHMKSVPVKVRATHVYGKPVHGQVMIKEFLKTAAGDPEQQQSAGNWTMLDDEGEAEFHVDLTPYQHDGGWRQAVLQKRLLIEAVVLEQHTSKQESAFTDKALFEHNLYKIISNQMQPEIRPGFPALVTILVRHPNGQIASDVAVEIKVLDDEEKKVTNLPQKLVRTDQKGVASFLVPTSPTFSQIRVALEVGNPPETSSVTKILKAYRGREYIALTKTPVTKTFSIGDEVKTQLNFHPRGAFTGAVVAAVTGGKIMATKNIRLSASSTKESLSFDITAEMSPKTRIIAIAWKNNGDISIDSFFISVEQSCRHADFELRQSIIRKPGGSGDIEFSGAEPGTIIGLMAVDEAVYAVRSGNLLTRDSIFSKLQAADRGCNDGGGNDLEKSAASAGIVVFTDKMDVSEGENCHTQRHHQRTRRAALAQRFKSDPLAEKCCLLAFTNYFTSKNCEERSQALISEFRKDNRMKLRCQKHFLDCCDKETHGYQVDKQVERVPFLASMPDAMLDTTRGRFGDEDIGIEEAVPESKVRKDFRESFLFQEVLMEDSNRKNIRVTLPHSITTWSIQSVSVNPRGGVCAQPPIQVPIEKNFFLQVELPYKVVRNEHVLIKVSMYNYNPFQITGNLYINGVEDVCTQARPGERSDKISFLIAANSAFKVDIPVFPLKEGYFPLKVDAISSTGSDSVVKELYVVPEGREVRQSYSVAIDPTNTQRRKARSIPCGPSCKSQIDPVRKNQTITIDTLLPEDVVEGTPQVTLSVIGEKMGPAMHASFNDIDSLISLPKGCGEQNMMRLAPLVFITEYRKQTGKLDSKHENKIKQNMMLAYSRQMTFQKSDGSFSAFRNRASSVWLTAFVAKVFCRASQFFANPQTFPAAASEAIRWLTRKQQEDGSFNEIKPILHKSLLGGVRGKLALTSFVTAALDECALHLTEDVRPAHRQAVSKAKLYLMKNYDTTTDGYPAALVAYALSGSNYTSLALDQMRNLMIADAETNTLSLKKDDNHPWVIEGTAYALLAATKAKKANMGAPIFYWLIAQQTLQGGFQSTQDTVVALQALSEFLSSNPQPPVDLSVHVHDGRNVERTLRVIRESASIPQTFSTNAPSDKLQVHATGYGSGVLSVLIKYNTLIPIEEKCPFNVTISARESEADSLSLRDIYTLDEQDAVKTLEDLLQRHRRQKRAPRADQLAYRLEVCAYLLSDTATAMSIVQVDMITGYVAIKEDLVNLVNQNDIDKFEILPDRVTLYVSEFEPHRNTCFAFRVAQEFTVVNAQPAAVSVYDYYNKIGNCPIFYELSQTRRVLVECNGEVDKMCKCLQNSCPPQVAFDTKTRADLTFTRTGRDRAQRLVCDHDFVVEGQVVELKRDQRTLFFKMNVTYAWRETSPMQGSVVTFMQKDYCKNLMATGLTYMVFGDETIPHRSENGTVYKSYSLNENSIVFFPNGQADNHIKGNFDLLKVRKVVCSGKK